MTITEEMSIPQWKVALLKKQQIKREEQERKAKEEDEKRRAKLPPWKRHAEQPKTVIFIDKNNVANPVHLSDKVRTSKDSPTNNNAPIVNGNAPNINSKSGLNGTDKTGSDDVDGVSEEHCTSVHDNPFLKLEKKKRRAPPPPITSGSNINIIATNVSVNATASGAKSSKSNKTTVSQASDKGKTNHLPNGPISVTEIQTKSSSRTDEKSSTKSAEKSSIVLVEKSTNSHEKRNEPSEKSSKSFGKSSSVLVDKSTKLQEKSSNGTDVQKNKSAATKSASSVNSTTSGKSDGAPLSTGSIKVIRNTENDSKNSLENQSLPDSPRRKASIVELRNIFSGPSAPLPSPTSTTAPVLKINNKTQSSSVPSNGTKNDTKISGLSDSKSDLQATSKDAKKEATIISNSTTTKASNSLPIKENSSTTKNSIKNGESKKNEVNLDLKTKAEEKKSLPEDKVLKKRPSESDMSASAIISLTNEGPLKKRDGNLKRSSSIFDEEVVVSLDSKESPRSPEKTNQRLKRYEEASKSSAEDGKDTRKRRAPVAPLLDAKKSEEKSEEAKSEISYPKNFRNPEYVPPKEEIPYPSDFRKATRPSSQDKTSSHSTVKKSGDLSSSIKDTKAKNDDSVHSNVGSSTLSNSAEAKESIDRTSAETKLKVESDTTATEIPYPDDFRKSNNRQSNTGTTGSAKVSSGQEDIPYPDDFRKPKKQSSNALNSSPKKKDIVKPSDLISSSSPAKETKKNESSSDSGASSLFGGFKLRKTKKPESSGITVISANDNNAKPTVDPSSRSTSSLIKVGGGGVQTTTETEKKKKAAVKKFEKVDFIGYNSPTNKPSALKSSTVKSSKRKVSFTPKEEEIYEYLSEDASTKIYDEEHPDGEEEEETKPTTPITNGTHNGSLNSDDDEDDGSNKAVNKSGGFQSFAASTISMEDMLRGRVPREQPKETPKPAPSPEPEKESENMDLKPDEGPTSFFSTGTADLLF